jgi:hypothetical protein
MSAFALASEIAQPDDKNRGRKSKINAKHKLRLADQSNNEMAHKYMFKSVRNQVLQKLMVIWFVWFYNSNSEGGAELIKRYEDTYKTEPESIGALAKCLKPEDVMETINCNRRTAIEYIQVLRFIRPSQDYF